MFTNLEIYLSNNNLKNHPNYYIHFSGQGIKKVIKKISDSPPETLISGKTSTVKKKLPKKKTLFEKITEMPVTEEDKDRVKKLSKTIIKRLNSREPTDRRKNELLLKQIVLYLAAEYNTVTIYNKLNFYFNFKG